MARPLPELRARNYSEETRDGRRGALDHSPGLGGGTGHDPGRGDHAARAGGVPAVALEVARPGGPAAGVEHSAQPAGGVAGLVPVATVAQRDPAQSGERTGVAPAREAVAHGGADGGAGGGVARDPERCGPAGDPGPGDAGGVLLDGPAGASNCAGWTADFPTSRRTLTVRRGKGHKDRVVPIGARAVQWVERYLAEVRPRLCLDTRETALFLTDGGPFNRTS